MPEDSQGFSGILRALPSRALAEFPWISQPFLFWMCNYWGEKRGCASRGGTARGSEPRNSAGISALGDPSAGTGGGSMRGCWRQEFSCLSTWKSSGLDPDEVIPGMLRDQSGLWQWAER